MSATGLLSRLITLGLLATVILAPTQFGFEVAKKTHLSLVDPVVWATFGLWLVREAVTGAWRTRRVNLAFPLLFITWAGLSLFKGHGFARVAKELFQLAEYFLAAYLLFVTALSDRATRRWLLTAFVTVSGVVIALGAVHYLSPDVEAFKVRSTFLNANTYGGYLSLALPLMAGLLLWAPGRAWRIGLGAAVLAGAATVLSGGTVIALSLALAAVAMGRGWKAFLGYAAVFFLLVFGAMPHLPRSNLDAARESVAIYNDDGEVTRRYPEWGAAVEMTREHPVLGVGMGAYQERIGEFYGIIPVPPGKAAPADSQNLYLVLASSIGLPGLALFLGLLFYGLGQALRGLARSTDPWLKGAWLGAAGSLAAYMINAVWSPLLVRGIGIPLAFVLALCVARVGEDLSQRHGGAENA